MDLQQLVEYFSLPSSEMLGERCSSNAKVIRELCCTRATRNLEVAVVERVPEDLLLTVGKRFENVSVTGDVTADGPKAAGIVAHGRNADLTNQIAFVGSVEASKEAGGILGRASSSTEVSFAYAQADVVTTGTTDGEYTDDAAGGIVGDSGNKGAFEEIYFNGTVDSDGGENEGAIIGAVNEGDDHTNVHWNRDYAPQDGVGGGGTADTTNYHSLTTAEMQGSAAEENMDFDWESTWQTVAGGYPVFQSQVRQMYFYKPPE